MALSLSRANIKGGSVTSWYIQTAASTAWVSIPHLRNGKVNFTTLSSKDAKGRNIPYAARMVATAQTMATKDLTGIVEVLDAMVAAEVDSQIELDNGEVIDTSLVAPTASESGAGFSWRFVSDADRDDVTYIEFRAERIMSIAEVDTVLGGSLGTLTASDSGFTAWAPDLTDVVPAGITTVKADSDASGYEHNFGIIRNGKFEAETLSVADSYGRNVSDGRIRVHFEAEMLQASSTETSLLDDIAALDAIDWQITFASGRIFTAANLLGFDYDFEVGTDRDGVSFIKIMADGVIASSAWDASWT